MNSETIQLLTEEYDGGRFAVIKLERKDLQAVPISISPFARPRLATQKDSRISVQIFRVVLSQPLPLPLRMSESSGRNTRGVRRGCPRSATVGGG